MDMNLIIMEDDKKTIDDNAPCINNLPELITPVKSSQKKSTNGKTDEVSKSQMQMGTSVMDTSDKLTSSDFSDRSSEIPLIDSGGETSFTQMIELPSAVTDREKIFMPLDIKNDDSRIYGKWMLFTHGDMYLQDRMWIQLQTLLVSRVVILLESSTAKKCSDRGQFQGVIKCYTCEDIGIIKHSGIAIRNIIKNDIILNYKTNQASKDRLYRKYGNRFISKYMLTVNGKLYERDKLERWKQISDDGIKVKSPVLEENLANKSIPEINIPPCKKRQQSGTEILPSQETSKKRYTYPSYASMKLSNGMWFLFCDAVDIKEDGMTELDHTWEKAKNLCDEGVFTLTSCQTYAFQPPPGENIFRRSVCCELRDYNNLDRIVQSGDKLRERTASNLPMYFKVCHLNNVNKISFSLKYLYMDDGELYEHAEEHWRLLKTK